MHTLKSKIARAFNFIVDLFQMRNDVQKKKKKKKKKKKGSNGSHQTCPPFRKWP